MECLTCRIIATLDKTYPVRDAVFGITSGRCLWHAWDDDKVFVCSQCGNPRFFEQIAWCKETNQYICTTCAPSQWIREPFWFWKGYATTMCPYCGREHPTLNRGEFEGQHPWQVNPFACRQFPIWFLKTIIQKEERDSVNCPRCSIPLSVKGPGTYKCPHCNTLFTLKKKSSP